MDEDPAWAWSREVVARCRVRIERWMRGAGSYREVEARPVDYPVPAAMIDPECWNGHFWVFSTVFARVRGTIDTLPADVTHCDLFLCNGGFEFRAIDPAELSMGEGI